MIINDHSHSLIHIIRGSLHDWHQHEETLEHGETCVKGKTDEVLRYFAKHLEARDRKVNVVVHIRLSRSERRCFKQIRGTRQVDFCFEAEVTPHRPAPVAVTQRGWMAIVIGRLAGGRNATLSPLSSGASVFHVLPQECALSLPVSLPLPLLLLLASISGRRARVVDKRCIRTTSRLIIWIGSHVLCKGRHSIQIILPQSEDHGLYRVKCPLMHDQLSRDKMDWNASSVRNRCR